MIEIEDKIISDDIFEERFCCDLSKCKGICCIEGDSGAPLDIEEVEIIAENIDTIKRYMSEDGIEAINKDGVYVIDSDGDLTTTLINGGECAYVVYDNDIALCAIEKAYRDGAITFKKPISCHLYPIRVSKFSNNMVGLNYHRWSVCSGARECGKRENVKVYQGLKEPIIRAYGEQFYTYMCEVDEIIERGDIDYEE